MTPEGASAPGRWCPVLMASTLPEGEGINLSLEGRPVAVFRREGRLFALEGLCPHRGAPLGDSGHVEGGTVTCLLHDWEFDLETGRGVNNREVLRTYPVRERNGYVEICVAEGNDGPFPN